MKMNEVSNKVSVMAVVGLWMCMVSGAEAKAASCSQDQVARGCRTDQVDCNRSTHHLCNVCECPVQAEIMIGEKLLSLQCTGVSKNRALSVTSDVPPQHCGMKYPCKVNGQWHCCGGNH